MAHLQYVVIRYQTFTLNAKVTCETRFVVRAFDNKHICFAVISLSVIEAITVIMLIFLRMRLRIAIALLEEGSR